MWYKRPRDLLKDLFAHRHKSAFFFLPQALPWIVPSPRPAFFRLTPRAVHQQYIHVFHLDLDEVILDGHIRRNHFALHFFTFIPLSFPIAFTCGRRSGRAGRSKIPAIATYYRLVPQPLPQLMVRVPSKRKKILPNGTKCTTIISERKCRISGLSPWLSRLKITWPQGVIIIFLSSDADAQSGFKRGLKDEKQRR